MLEKYEKYLNQLKDKLDLCFNDQKEYLKCKAGCAICCKNSYYPVSKLEYEYMKKGMEENLTNDQIEQIKQKAIQIIKDRTVFLKEGNDLLDFQYECPFLANNSCNIYENRALLCRSHGLIHQDLENPNKINLLHCIKFGYNYSDIVDTNTNKISIDKIKRFGFENMPKVFDLSYSSMISRAEDVEFGDIRMLVEWIVMDIPNYQELIKEECTPV
jgi:Fe-S-cluster containining protein